MAVLVAVALALFPQAPATASDPPQQLSHPPGVSVMVWAAPEQAHGARKLDVDLHGQLWALHEHEGVELRVLQDADGDGRCDRATSFQSWPQGARADGVVVLGERVLAAVDGTLFELADDDGDGRANAEMRKLGTAGGVALAPSPRGVAWSARGADASSTTIVEFDVDGPRTLARGSALREPCFDSFGGLYGIAESQLVALHPGGASHSALELPGGGARGLALYESRFIPEAAGALLIADARAGVLRAVKLEREGAELRLTPVDFVSAPPHAADEAPSFRPVDVAIGIDSTLYVADEASQQILRIGPSGRRLANPRMDLGVRNGQLSALLSASPSVRASAAQVLALQGEDVLDALAGIAKSREPHWQARALALMSRASERGRALVREQLSHADEWVRIAALRALVDAGASARELAPRFVGDPSTAARAAALRTLAQLEWDAKRAIVLALAAPAPQDSPAFDAALAAAAASRTAELVEALRTEPPAGWDAARLAALIANLESVAR